MTQFFSRNFVNVLLIALGSVASGFSIGYPSPVNAELSMFMRFTKMQGNIFKSITPLTSIFGPAFANLALNQYGRRMALCAVSAVSAFSWFLLCLASEGAVYNAYIHRGLVGIAMGGYATVIPLYIMEITPVADRTAYGTLNQFGISFGVFIANLFGAFISWRNLALVGAGIPILQIVLSKLIPESPVFTEEMTSIEASISVPRESLCVCKNAKPLFICGMLLLFQQVSGVNPVQLNLSSLMNSRMGPTIAASSKLIAGFLCVPMLACIGRKGTWALSCFGCAISLFLLAFSFGTMENVAIGAAFSFLFSFCLGLGPIPWFIIPEMFDDTVRSQASSLLTSCWSLFSFAITLLYPITCEFVGCGKTLAVFGVFMVIGGIFGLYVIRSHPKEYQAQPLDLGIDLNNEDVFVLDEVGGETDEEESI